MLRKGSTFSTTQIDDKTILRDDLLPGGTKRRALQRWLPSLNQSHFIYAGSVFGSGGWALAEACRDLGFTCTLALSRSDYSPQWLEQIDCQIEWFAPQPVEHIYKSYGHDKKLLPLGYDDLGFKSCLAEVFGSLDRNHSEIWLPCVSGVLVQAAQIAWPEARINAVCVAKNHGNIGNAIQYQAAEKYHQPAHELPPYPANLFSDAKLWQFVRQFALKDALIWNTSI
ncbi:MAG: hypothetical protein DI586_10675 [Micavibrio aeruginosavorus]|uniref:Tryptophan synthase beta chain-like PALP domain-containing protein n=1 Tax=Micavibrio aeruginosavorus TaxID=349221 RepID=A0A2W5HDZ6_9BACT|nr:MAG: hypothetical protein DI586_10675 [Micavibrio aeruginosavorus]